MKRVITIVEEYWVKVYSPSEILSGHGFFDYTQEIIFFDKPWKSEEDSQQLLEQALLTYRTKNSKTFVSKPIIKNYWKVIEKEEKEIKQ